MKRLVQLTRVVVVAVAGALLLSAPAMALTNPASGSTGLEGTIPSNPPTRGATITTPVTGQTFTSIPVTVSGLCPSGLLVKVFANNVFVGSVMCANGSYSIQVDLFSGRNDLVARVYDALDQPGPDSNVVTVTFLANQYNPSDVQLVSLTSDYARRGANPGQTLTWPIILSGGTGPYALSVDWGDGKAPDLISEGSPGAINLSHVYDAAGVYSILIKATDAKGVSAFLQLVGVANGAIVSSSTATTTGGSKPIVQVLWLPAALCIPLIALAFWLGGRYKLAGLRKHLESLNY